MPYAANTKGINWFKEFDAQPRWDIVCYAEHLVIDEPIRSNGGSVILIADELELKAPVDTRPYFLANPERPLTFLSDGFAAGKYRQSPELQRLYGSYYTKAPDAIRSGNDIWLPEMPSGLNGKPMWSCEGGATYDGGPGVTAPDDTTIFENVKSGDIYVVATIVRANEESLSKGTLLRSDPLSCAEPAYEAPALIAAGVRGARGGAGGIGSFYGDIPTQVNNAVFSCVDDAYRRRGSLNGPGGRGGDAGNVWLNIVGRTISEEERTHLRAVITVKGGTGGSRRKVYTPAIKGTYGAKSWDACGFLDVQESWPEAPHGADGTASIEPRNANQAFQRLGQLLSTRDARIDYSFLELIRRAETDNTVIGISFESYMARRLLLSVISAQMRLVGTLSNDALMGSPNPEALIPPLFDGLELTALANGDTPQVLVEPLNLLSTFKRLAGHNGRDSYFIRSGGAFSLRDKDVYSSWLSIANRYESANVPIKLDQVRATLSDVATSLNDIRKVVLSAEFSAAILALQGRIQAVEKLVRLKNNGNLDLVSDALGKMSKAAGAFVASYTSGSMLGAGAAAAAFVSAIDEYGNRVQQRHDVIDGLPDLRTAFNELNKQFADFLRYTIDERIRYTRERARAVEDLLDSRVRLIARLSARTPLISDMMRLALMSWSGDLSRNRSILWQNLEGIRTILADYPQREPQFNLSRVTDPCGVTYAEWLPRGCVLIQPSSNWRIVTASSSEGWMAGLPLYVVAPSHTEVVVATHGLRVEISPLESEPQQLRFMNRRLQYAAPMAIK